MIGTRTSMAASGRWLAPSNSNRPMTRGPRCIVTSRSPMSRLPTVTGVSVNIVGSSGTGGGAALPGSGNREPVVIVTDDPTWISVMGVPVGGVIGGRGTRTVLIVYWPAGTPRNVKSPAAPVIVTDGSSVG